MSTPEGKTAEAREGFELQSGTDNAMFYEWQVTSRGKDLQLIDRITGGMLPQEFFSCLKDPQERQRGPILMTLIATSMRARHPEWSVNRIERTVMELDLEEDVVFIGGDDDEPDEVPAMVPPAGSSDDVAVTPVSSESTSGSPDSPSETPSETQP